MACCRHINFSSSTGGGRIVSSRCISTGAAVVAGAPLSPRLPSFKAGWHVPRIEVPEAVKWVRRQARPQGWHWIKNVTRASREAAAVSTLAVRIVSRERWAHEPQAGN
jgi:hypothetical protein